MELHERLRQARIKRGFRTARSAADYMSVPRSTYNHHEIGARRPKESELLQYARVFRIPVEWLAFGSGAPPTWSDDKKHTTDNTVDKPRNNVTDTPQLAPLYVKGEVVSGVWTEMDSVQFKAYAVEVPTDPRFDQADQFLLRIGDSSVNRRAVVGGLLRCLDADAAPRQPRDGDWVVVRRESGSKVEMTVRQIRSGPDGVPVLWPDSTDPEHQTPLRLAGDEEGGARIVAFALDFISPATRF